MNFNKLKNKLNGATEIIGNVAINSDTVLDSIKYNSVLDCDTTNNTITLTTHQQCNKFIITDVGKSFGTNNCIIDAETNNETIQGEPTLEIDVNDAYIEFERVGTDWKLKYADIVEDFMIYKTTNTDYTAVDNNYLYINTTDNEVNITLPENPIANTLIMILDVGGKFDENNVVLNRNESTIMGENEDLNLNVANKEYKVVYTGTDWRVI